MPPQKDVFAIGTPRVSFSAGVCTASAIVVAAIPVTHVPFLIVPRLPVSTAHVWVTPPLVGRWHIRGKGRIVFEHVGTDTLRGVGSSKI